MQPPRQQQQPQLDAWAEALGRVGARAAAAAAGSAASTTPMGGTSAPPSSFQAGGPPQQQPLWLGPLAMQPQQQDYQRGLDAGLARSIPTDFDGKATSYRDYRRRLLFFQRLCARRWPDCEAEGALTLLQILPSNSWDETKHLDLKIVESSAGDSIRLFRHWPAVSV